jgi:valyl-tRNA synthetase
VLAGVEIVIPLEGVIDLAAELTRMKKELAKVEGDIAFLQKRLSNERYVSNAPAEVVAGDRAKLQESEAAQAKLLEGLRSLEGVA